MKMKIIRVADLFCGAGGSSTAAHRAFERAGKKMLLTCVNHWPVAVETHRRNHPDAEHFCQDISALRPLEAVPEGKLDLLMASPTCTHHSRARGGRPTSDQQRMDPWHVVTWLAEVDVDRLLIENVPEFMEYGPVNPRTGKPIAEKKGVYFTQWVNTIRTMGYTVDYRVLNAADYGDATTRKRFFLQARKDGNPIRWPAPTHAEKPVRGSGLKPWRAAREIIDWSLTGRSIFDRKKPLAKNTIRRIIKGAEKHGWPEAFIVVLRRHMDGQSLNAPLPTITAGGTHIGLAQVRFEPFFFGQQSCSAARGVDEPLMTISTGGAISLVEAVATPLISPYYGSGSGETCKSAASPLDTVTTKAQFGLVEAVIKACETKDKQDRVVMIDGKPYVLDILYRMLQPHELAAAMSFSVDEFEYEFVGTKTDTIKQIGNAVPIQTATALVSALMDLDDVAIREAA